MLPSLAGAAAEAGAKSFDLPAGDAERALRDFSAQSGVQVLFSSETATGVRTNAVKGEFIPGEAMNRLLDRTGLVARQNVKSGALVISRRAPADPATPEENAERAAQTTASDLPRQNPSSSGNSSVSANEEEQTIELSPFEVTTDKDTGFAAANALAGGRLATDLRDTPVAYAVMTREFIDALQIVDLADAASWITNNTEFVGQGEQDFFANTGAYRTRGFNAASGTGGSSQRQRNFFPMQSLGDSYNTERYDFGRGPNAILFGNGSLGGVSSSTTKRAQTNRGFQTIETSVGSWQQFRTELDVNQPLLDGRAAVRTSLLWQDSDDWRRNDFDNRKAAFLTTTLKPFRNTEIRLDGEYFKIWRQTGQTDIAESFAGWDGATTFNSVQPLATLPPNANALGVGRRGNYYIFDPHGPANAIMNYINEPTTLGGGATSTTPIAGFTQVGGSFNSSGAPLLHPNHLPAGRFDTAIANSSFRPITEEFTIGSDNPQVIQVFKDVQLTVRQQLGDNLFFEAGGDVNTADFFASRNSALQATQIDINRVLPNGAANPNFLQPYNDYDATHRYLYSFNNRNFRAAAAYVVPANRFGKFAFNVLGGLNHQERIRDFRQLTLREHSDHRQWITQSVRLRRYWNAPSQPGLGEWDSSGRDLGATPVNFIDPSTGVSKVIQPGFTLRNDNPDAQQINTSDFNYGLVSLTARFFKDRLVVLGAVRRDTYKFSSRNSKNRGDYPLDWDGLTPHFRPDAPADYFDLTFQPKNAAGVPNAPVQTAISRPRLPGTFDRNPLFLNDRFQDDFNPPELTGSQVTKSFGAVLHLFSWFNPSYNYAETFNPPTGAPRIDGQLFEPTVAEGADYGLRMELFERRLDLNFVYYEGEEINAVDPSTFANNFNTLINANVKGDQSLTGTNIQGVAPINGAPRDSRSLNTQGFEIEVAYNPTKALRLTGNFSKPKTGTSNRFPDYLAYIAANATAFRNIAVDAGALVDANNVASVDQSVPINDRSPDVQAAVNTYNAIFEFQKEWTGKAADIGESQSRGNLFADYTFQNGWLKRLRVGAGIQYFGKVSIGSRANDSIVNPANPAQAIDDPAVDGTDRINRPAYSLVTGTLAYSWKWRDRDFQASLVVKNLLNKRGPIYTGTALRPRGGDFTSPARERVFNRFALHRPINFLLSLTLKL